ncbi:hypothetical protein M404DRAFT_31126 [Pisolithus tinctorius Marx 270]|uniref:Uncharacterized protein n=1 Tax=Pisolithus tinctorius Marx 270 TaxID=870435 RepID=A0A0C3NT08_PISTI|nr:hypothetical protein M404DRAFT_31126 [Pisolithus tinctorius Marx 270]
MSSQRQNKTPQPNPGHSCDYSQVTNDDLVILTDDSTDTEHEKTVEKARQREERQKVEEVWQEAEWRQREEEEVQRKKVAEEEAEKQRQKAVAEEAERQRQRAQARWDEAAQRLCGTGYDVNTAQKVPGASMVVTVTRWPPCTRCVASLMAGQCEPGQEAVVGPSQKRAGTGSSQGEKKKRTQGKGKERVTEMEEADDEWEAGGEDEEEPETPLKGPLGVSSWWMEWEWEWQLQAAEKYAAAHEKAATAFERMAEAVEWMAEAAEWTADEWGMYHTWAEWAEMRRREDTCKARLAELECGGGGWKRPQSEAAEYYG